MADSTEICRFTWNGQAVAGRSGESVAEALFRAGHLHLACTRKRHRPLGLSGSFIQGVLANVDDVPNQRLDQVPVAAGLRITRQNNWPWPRADLLQVFRLIPPRWVRGGFEHYRHVPSGTRRFLVWERLLAFLAGEGSLSLIVPSPPVAGRRLVCDALIVGAGPAGIRAANARAAGGQRVVLVTRGMAPARSATAMQVPIEALHAEVQFFAAHEACAVYRTGHLVLAAPVDGGPALAIDCGELVLAIGQRSMPPLVNGNSLPGVMDAPTALNLATTAAAAMGRVVIIGTSQRDRVADRLRALGVDVVASAAIDDIHAIKGWNHVTAVDTGQTIPCRTIVHAGPWRTDPNLVFQAASDGLLRLEPGTLADHVHVIGQAAAADEDILWRGDGATLADVCPCMDVTAGEISDLVRSGVDHVEEIKRQTSAGMGPCQGFPCWELTNAVIAASSPSPWPADRPSHRPPRRALTVAQAAGLSGLVEPLR